MNRNKGLFKMLIIAVLLAGALIIGGWGQKPVELSLSGLIDLDKAIDLSVRGINEAGENNEAVSDNSADDGTADDKKQKDTDDDAESAKKVIVRVTGREIKCDGNTYSSYDKLIGYINTKYKGNLSVRLTDDYAVAGVYHSVDDALDSWCREKGYAYEAD
ncbi:MAG: hypothetical protein II966_00210 [Lachnospiraceae bacterium]|nr:hypothetical protein [Lachnospiraceae bacterium]